MATAQQAPDRIESMESLDASGKDADQTPVTVENINDHPPSIEVEQMASNVPVNSKAVGLPIDVPNQLGPLNVGGDQNAFYLPNYGPQTQTFFYGGYETPIGEWEEYPRYSNGEGLEVGPAGVYNENQSFPYHAGYGYSQMPYGLFSPVTSPLPSVNGDGQLYSPQHFPFSGGFYQQPAFTSMPFLSSVAPPPISQADLAVPADQQGAFLADSSNPNNMLYGPRPSYQPSYGSFGGDWLKSSDGTGSATPFFSPAASPQPTNAFMSFGQSSMPLASGMAPRQQRSSYAFGSAISSYDRGYHGGIYHGNTYQGAITKFGVSGRSSVMVDRSRRQGEGDSSLCSCTDTLDFLTEHNRGPRANRSKNQLTEQHASVGDDIKGSTGGVDRKLYNSPDFITGYKDAKFFVIKSYSEDNVHKSIKYGVWASTSHGNRKLDSSYHEAKEKEEPCPLFLFFSVNASGHFCGVAEMIGPVDFEKSVDYWQQDKWSGHFPVKWHIVKDIPNSLFRHIILENNGNKPVTNSRDTQEVKLEQGLEMLSIFAKHEHEASILDDLEFYEEQEKAMLERKVHHHQQLSAPSAVVPLPAAAGDEQRNMAAISGDLVNQMSKSFAEVVRIEERTNGDLSSTDKSSSLGTGAATKPEDPSKQENTCVPKSS